MSAELATGCRDVREKLVEYLSGNLGTADRDAVSAHLLSCHACLLATAELAQWRVSLRSVMSPESEARERLWNSVLTQARPGHQIVSGAVLNGAQRPAPSAASGPYPASGAAPAAATGFVPGLDLIARVAGWVAEVSQLGAPRMALALPMGLELDLPLLRGN